MVQSYGSTGGELRQRSNSPAPAKSLTTTDEGRKADELLDKHLTYVFFGSLQVQHCFLMCRLSAMSLVVLQG